MRYKIVHQRHPFDSKVIELLNNDVQQLCDKGWKPFGNLIILQEKSGEYLATQAMIKE